MIKVFLCDDHALIRRGIRDTLSDAPDIEVVGEAGDYGELRALMREKSADVLVLDINLPGPQRPRRAARAEGRRHGDARARRLDVPRGPVRDPGAARRRVRLRQQGRRPGAHRQRRAHGGAGPQVRDARDRADAGREPDDAGGRERARQAFRPRDADAGHDRVGQAPLGHRRGADAEPEDGERLSRARAREARPRQQLRDDGLRDPAAAWSATSGARRAPGSERQRVARRRTQST